MVSEFVEWLNRLRREVDKPLVLLSAYRCPEHPIEKAKTGAFQGSHVLGVAADIRVDNDAMWDDILATALNLRPRPRGRGIGKGVFHFDLNPRRRARWTYK